MVWRYHSIKVLINSLFGATGFFRGRHYKYECCQNVQSIERVILPETIAFVESLGIEVVGADTDSVFVVVSCIEEAMRLSEVVTEHINQWVREEYHTIDEDCFVMEAEKFFESMMIIAKKKYAGIVVHDGNKPVNYLYKRGLESVRHDWPMSVKIFQDKLLVKMLKDEDWKAYIKDTKRAFDNGELDHEMAIFKTLKKPVEEYETMPPHVRASLMMDHPVRIGDKVGYLKVGPEKTSLVVANSDGSVDIPKQNRPYVWGHMFKPIIDRFGVKANMTLDQFM